MPLTQSDLDWFAARLSIAVYDTNREIRAKRMSAQNITGLADVIRQAKEALSGIPAVADEVKNTTASVLSKVEQVKALVTDLKSAETQLDGVLKGGSNGGPPLATSQESSVASATTLAQPSPVSETAPERLTVNGVSQA